MNVRDRLLAALVAALWGLNFVAFHEALTVFPPYMLIAVRFALIAVPTVLFVPRPDVRLRWLVACGLSFGVLQFGFLYAGMRAGLPAGLASLLLQAATPVTMALAVVFLRERITARHGLGMVIAVLGFVVIAVSRAESSKLVPVALGLTAAVGWALSNVFTRAARTNDALRLALWISVVPPLPMLIVSLVVEGPQAMGAALAAAGTVDGIPALLGLSYMVVLGNVVGVGIWTALLARNLALHVVPFSMLVPITGFTSAWAVLGQRPSVGDAVGSVVVIVGLLFATSTRRFSRGSDEPGRWRRRSQGAAAAAAG